MKGIQRLSSSKLRTFSLMNHDITSGYIITDVERLRAPMQQITDYLLRCMGVKKSADIIYLNQSRNTHENLI